MRLFHALLLVICCGHFQACADEKPEKKATQTAEKPAEKWFDLTDIGDHIFEEKQEFALTKDEATQIFVKEISHLAADWREKIAQPIENLPDARHVKDAHELVREYLGDNGKPAYASLRMFSKTHLRVMVFKYLGQWRFHHYYECQASFKVPRNAELDVIFGLKELEKLYCETVKGIGYGDSGRAVTKALGEPDGIQVFGPMGISRRAYFEDDVVIFFQDGRVKTITRGVPERLKKKVREEGKVFAYY